MDNLAEYLNNLLIEAYSSISKIEEHTISKAGSFKLSISEIHLIEAIGKSGAVDCAQGKTISQLSEIIKVTLPSVTLAINKLVNKGYVTKRKSETDGRVVYVTLTKRGEKVNRVHQHFHKRMVLSVTDELSKEELDAMIKGVIKLNLFLKQKITKEDT